MENYENIEMWGTIRALWASGRYATLGALYRKCVELYADDCPTIGTLRRRADREMWKNDSAMSEEMQHESEKTAAEILSELGMGMTRRLELLTDIITAPHEDHDRIKSILDKLFKGEGGEVDEKSINGALRELKVLYSKGMEISLKALALAAQYAGDFNGKQPGKDSDGKDVLKMTEEERQVEIERMLKSLGMKLMQEKSDIETKS